MAWQHIHLLGHYAFRDKHDPIDVDTLRSKIEQFHREEKQLTGIERCQYRKTRIQRNHIACTILVWIRLAAIAKQTGETLSRIKNDYLMSFYDSNLKNLGSLCDLHKPHLYKSGIFA